MKRVAVLIPCYNESKTIAKVVQDYKAALPEADIYVYDNNSTDHTDEIAAAAGAIVRYERRQGKDRACGQDVTPDPLCDPDDRPCQPSKRDQHQADLPQEVDQGLKQNMKLLDGHMTNSFL